MFRNNFQCSEQTVASSNNVEQTEIKFSGKSERDIIYMVS